MVRIVVYSEYNCKNGQLCIPTQVWAGTVLLSFVNTMKLSEWSVLLHKLPYGSANLIVIMLHLWSPVIIC